MNWSAETFQTKTMTDVGREVAEGAATRRRAAS
jgi:hypothetical protein